MSKKGDDIQATVEPVASHEQQMLSEKHDHLDGSSPAPAKDGDGFSAPTLSVANAQTILREI